MNALLWTWLHFIRCNNKVKKKETGRSHFIETTNKSFTKELQGRKEARKGRSIVLLKIHQTGTTYSTDIFSINEINTSHCKRILITLHIISIIIRRILTYQLLIISNNHTIDEENKKGNHFMKRLKIKSHTLQLINLQTFQDYELCLFISSKLQV